LDGGYHERGQGFAMIHRSNRLNNARQDVGLDPFDEDRYRRPTMLRLVERGAIE